MQQVSNMTYSLIDRLKGNRVKLDKAFLALEKHRERLSPVHMRELFADDSRRAQLYSVELGDLYFDFSKNRFDKPAFSALIDLARQADVERWRDAMFAGEKINNTENRAVLHTALRSASDEPLFVDGHDVMPDIRAVRTAMQRFADTVRSGDYRVSGGRISDVINIGIGGSNLGPSMAVRALAPYADGPRVHFVSNADSADLSDAIACCDPERTLIIIASKTFTTAETMINAHSAFAWVAKAVGRERAGRHFAALSTNLAATRAFGIADECTFGFWDWVGGRYSIWSAIGLSLMIATGAERFAAFLNGAYEVDRHFCSAPLERNIPVIMAMLGVWHRNIWGYGSHGILPYDDRLERFPAYIQQLDMESNGKQTTRNGKISRMKTGPVIWGETGTNAQHTFFQLLHQGTDIVPCDFLLAAESHESMADHHDMLVANCLAQSAALMTGKTLDEVKTELRSSGMEEGEIARLAPHRIFDGNRPSNILFYSRLTPARLGALLALYEHKIFVQGIIWNINSFDQWGVELGKSLANDIQTMLAGEEITDAIDASTQALIARYRKIRSPKF
jgi:glucose-6-phosphate isomerase